MDIEWIEKSSKEWSQLSIDEFMTSYVTKEHSTVTW